MAPRRPDPGELDDRGAPGAALDAPSGWSRLRDLAGASVAMTEASSVDGVLGVATSWARRVVGAHQAVASVTTSEDWAQAITSVSLSDRYARWRSYDVPTDGSGIYGLVCRENRPYRLTQAELEAHPSWRGFGAQADAHPPMRGWLAVPLMARDGTNLGLLQLSDKDDGGDFSEEDEAALVQLARLASAEVERIRQLDVARSALAELERQHELTATISENATSALFLMDERGHPTHQNAAAQAMFGYLLDEIRGAPLHEAIHHTRPDGSPYPMSECPIDRALPERRWVEPYEDLFVRKDGTFVPVAAAASPILRDGVAVGTVVEVRDLTAEKAAHAELARQHELTRTITENASSALVFVDHEGRPTYVNRAWVAMTGFALDEISHRTTHEVVHHTRPDGTPYPADECPIIGALPGRRRVEPYEDVFFRRDGTPFPVRVAGSPIIDGDEPVGTVIEVVDITEERRSLAARQAAETRLRFLVEASEALTRSFDYREGLQEVARLAVPVLGDACAIDLAGETGAPHRAATAEGDGAAGLAAAVPGSTGGGPLAEAWRTGRAVVVDDLRPPPPGATGVTSLMAVPLTTGDRVAGVLTLLAAGGRRYEQADVDTAREVARRAAVAVENARLFERGEFQRSLLEAQGEASIDGLAVVAPDGRYLWHNRRFADIWGLSEEVLAGGDAAAVTQARPLLADPEAFAAQVREIYERNAVDHRELRLRDGRTIERYGAPLVGPEGRRYGYLWSFRDITERKQTEEQLAQLYQREREVSHRLQMGLLSTDVPNLEDLVITAAYRPGTAALEVGGDWYDAFQLPGGSIALVVGDVVGHGVDAAATMGQLRGAVRALAPLGDPGQVLTDMGRVVVGLPGADMSTLVVARLDPASGALCFGCAGHPPPLVVGADGSTRLLWGGRSTPLGYGPRGGRADAHEVLGEGETLVLFTDGLVERRGESLDVGLERLARAARLVAAGSDRAADALCDALLGAGHQADDVCVLVAHRPERRAMRHCFEASPGGLAALRARLAPWLAEQGLDEAACHEVVLVVNEAAANAIEHAYGRDGNGIVTVRARVDGGHVLHVTVHDDGGWREPRPDPSRGRGFGIMRALMDDVHVAGGEDGTVVELRRQLPASGA